ncbi:Cyclic di-GMP phosphodiesterase response regulator RpfG [Andreprevotia sp. IGB-42]|uniref:response regulator n=1 Tax=Andreprevotia sp. IGB-42 TaxID=2497473 RepID=UPI001356EEAF|nr:HD domain-containing phosphohydrolase [Andreprevotia sp. IGB-42]KAF0813294.1 Cyclic di-GMP phosphodiesterase response regulator RpfG [Andreprevotia sp. IGB-42]
MSNPLDFTQKRTVLVVDDTPDNLVLLNGLLKDEYRVKVATNGVKALQAARMAADEIDLILLDIMMPEMDGYECCRQLKIDESTRNIPVIFLTAKAETEDEEKGFKLGAVDYITKPINPAILLARVDTHIQLHNARAFLLDQNSYLDHLVKERTRQLESMQDATLLAMASLAQIGMGKRNAPIQRRQHYLSALAWQLQDHPRFADELTEEYIELLFKSAALYDIGMVAVPTHVLKKEDALNAAERELVQRHPHDGREVILTVERQIGTRTGFLRCAEEMAYHHHERWDGSGYPDGLAGTDIPLPARMVSVIDVYDALTSERPWRPAHPHDAAKGIIASMSGTGFEADIVDALLAVADKLEQIAHHYPD